MDPIKEAFFKIKQEISFLKEEINNINKKIESINSNTHIQTNPTHNMTENYQETNQQTHIQTNPTQNYIIQPLYKQNTDISTGNDGVPTDKLTYKPTIQPTKNTINSDFREANNILESLDNIKKEIRLKFKRLTPQEMLVFSTLYSLEEKGFNEITYKIIAGELNLSESSIRDYINKLQNKGIPIDKKRKNNKIILLKVSQDLKNIATLATIQTLKDL